MRKLIETEKQALMEKMEKLKLGKVKISLVA